MFLLLFVSAVAIDLNSALGRGTGRRYSQLTRLMQFYNKEFDERKYWAYGCNCMMLGDRPLSQPGLGPAVDELDKGKGFVLCNSAYVILHVFFMLNDSSYFNTLKKISVKSVSSTKTAYVAHQSDMVSSV